MGYYFGKGRSPQGRDLSVPKAVARCRGKENRMFCPRCGNLITPGKRFCGRCGAKIEAAPDLPEETSISENKE